MKRKKLYYVPGLISIVMLPILLFFWGPEDPIELNVLKLKIPARKTEQFSNQQFTMETFNAALVNKKIKTIDINEGSWVRQAQNITRSLVLSEIENIHSGNDTNVVLKVHMGTDCSYGNFIWTLNQALIYDFRRYALIDNELYFFPPTHCREYLEPADLSVISMEFPKVKTPTHWALFKMDIENKWDHLWYEFEYLFYRQQQNKMVGVGFLLLVVLPGIIKIRQYASRKRPLVLVSKNA